jgi:methionine-rich copper-binding protein CopC
MSSGGYKTIVALLLMTALAGCAGNGNGISSVEPLAADFKSIQDNIFTPICSKCHIGAGAPEGLQLDATHSYAALVGVPSTEQSNVMRVAPNDPNSSYIIRKLEGITSGPDAIAGVRMPFGGPYLPQSTIDVIAQWITDGAPNSTTAPAAAAATVKSTQRFSVAATSPDNDSIVDASPAHIIVSFSGDIDSTLLNATTVTLQSSDVTAPPVPVTTTIPPGDASAILITPGASLASGTYRVTLHGSLADMNAQALGSDYTLTFTVDALQ